MTWKRGRPNVRGDQVEQLPGLLGVAFDLEFVIRKDRGDRNAVQQVLHVIGGPRQLLHLGLQFGVDRAEFLVQRLQLLPGSLLEGLQAAGRRADAHHGKATIRRAFLGIAGGGRRHVAGAPAGAPAERVGSVCLRRQGVCLPAFLGQRLLTRTPLAFCPFFVGALLLAFRIASPLGSHVDALPIQSLARAELQKYPIGSRAPTVRIIPTARTACMVQAVQSRLMTFGLRNCSLFLASSTRASSRCGDEYRVST